MPNEKLPLADAPTNEWAAVLRTTADDDAWKKVRRTIGTPSSDGFLAAVEYFEEPGLRGLTPEQVLALIPDKPRCSLLVVVDDAAVASSEMSLLCIDLWDEPGRTVRVIAAELWGIENNLSIGNMEFADFADATDHDGVFRGF
ncbi:DUF6924 domain-containing protein [Streptomyces gamaensis]|uniref:DUF6924 domain-containing protein n=1 Tax=Streptomyces gamaensis TaxID=1763542 RepID=A0ABW0Z9N1_9ACTN